MRQAQQRTKLGRVSEKDPLVLGIESTCDETGVALVRGCDLLVDRTATSMDQYARYGGIIPEIASRAHLESFLPTLESALDEAGVTLNDVDAVAVAAGPGLCSSMTSQRMFVSSAEPLMTLLARPSIRLVVFLTFPTRVVRTLTAFHKRATPLQSVSREVWPQARTRNATSTTSLSPGSRPRLPGMSKALRNVARRSPLRIFVRAFPRPSMIP